MIAFRNERTPNNSGDLTKKLQKLLDIIHGDEKYYAGSLYKNTNLAELINIVNGALFKENHNSIHIIIDKKPNNSIDITIDKIDYND